MRRNVSLRQLQTSLPHGLGQDCAIDGTFSREDFRFDKERDVYICPAGNGSSEPIQPCHHQHVTITDALEQLAEAASVGGYGQERDLPNFRATDSAFGEIPAAFNDSLLPLNELGLLKGSAAEKYLRLRDFTYGFAEGRGTTYSKLAPIDGAGAALEWRSILLATGEEPANEIARDAHAIRMVGESVRWIDLIATRNGVADIFDRIPENVPEERRAKWAENRCITIRDGCEQNHGVAINPTVGSISAVARTQSVTEFL